MALKSQMLKHKSTYGMLVSQSNVFNFDIQLPRTASGWFKHEIMREYCQSHDNDIYLISLRLIRLGGNTYFWF